MATLDKQKVRARIRLGNLVIETPDVVSFNVRRERGQPSATFSASVKVSHDEVSNVSSIVAESIVIEAGLKGSLKTIFTGTIYRCVANPIRTDASKVMLNLSGRDVMSIMEGQKVNRRMTTYRTGDGPPERWGAITNVLQHSTPQKERFSPKMYQPKMAVPDVRPFYLERTPSISSDSKPIKVVVPKVNAQLEISKE